MQRNKVKQHILTLKNIKLLGKKHWLQKSRCNTVPFFFFCKSKTQKNEVFSGSLQMKLFKVVSFRSRNGRLGTGLNWSFMYCLHFQGMHSFCNRCFLKDNE